MEVADHPDGDVDVPGNARASSSDTAEEGADEEKGALFGGEVAGSSSTVRRDSGRVCRCFCT